MKYLMPEWASTIGRLPTALGTSSRITEVKLKAAPVGQVARVERRPVQGLVGAKAGEHIAEEADKPIRLSRRRWKTSSALFGMGSQEGSRAARTSRNPS